MEIGRFNGGFYVVTEGRQKALIAFDCATYNKSTKELNLTQKGGLVAYIHLTPEDADQVLQQIEALKLEQDK